MQTQQHMFAWNPKSIMRANPKAAVLPYPVKGFGWHVTAEGKKRRFKNPVKWCFLLRLCQQPLPPHNASRNVSATTRALKTPAQGTGRSTAPNTLRRNQDREALETRRDKRWGFISKEHQVTTSFYLKCIHYTLNTEICHLCYHNLLMYIKF